MNYELAKKLKEAGFPFIKHKDYDAFASAEDRCFLCGEYATKDRFEFCTPTLEELIDDCGDKFENLTHYHQIKWMDEKRRKYEINNFWVCNFSGNNVNSCEDEWESKGETKKEAVANLWLKIKNYEQRKSIL